MNHLELPTVLVLNKAWQAIETKTPQQAFPMMVTDVATALDIGGGAMVPTKWKDWVKLPIREQDTAIHTPNACIRIPTTIVLAKYAQVPKSAPTFSARAVKRRDELTCQYCGFHSSDPSLFNLDHVHPRKLGGKTNWVNIVCSCIPCNTEKGHMTLSEFERKTKKRLIKMPKAPGPVSKTSKLVNTHHVPDWNLFGVPEPTEAQ